MSASIKPPAGSAPSTTGVQGSADIKPAAAADTSAVQAPATHASHAAGAAASESASAALLRKLETGEVTRQQALDGLVSQALEVHGGARLPAAQRAELEQVLRATLLDDPVLARLIGAA